MIRNTSWRKNLLLAAVLALALPAARAAEFNQMQLAKSSLSFISKQMNVPVEGQFKSSHNASPNTAKLMAATFFALLDLADLSTTPTANTEKVAARQEQTPPEKTEEIPAKTHGKPSLHYNIQIHLPATKDIEVVNAIFKSLKEHLID